MKITYVPIKTAKKNVFKKEEVKESVNYDNFIDELRAIDTNQDDVIKEIARVIKGTDVGEDVKKELMRRFEENHNKN